MTASQPLWQPTADQLNTSELSRFCDFIERPRVKDATTYAALHRWSVSHMEEFWQALWDFTAVIGERGKGPVLSDPQAMPGAAFFADAKLNFTENLLRFAEQDGAAEALVFYGENQCVRRMSYAELAQQVAALSAALRALGVAKGDRVAGYVVNSPEAIIGMLASAALGAVWTSCSPDFGVPGVVDRLGQSLPKVLITSEYYFYNGKRHEVVDKALSIQQQVASIEHIIVAPYGEEVAANQAGLLRWHDLLAQYANEPLQTTAVGFNDPLYIMYSSGTTGMPKCIVHGVGGTLLQHLKEHVLHTDLKRDDVLFYFTTCGWMMWNWLVSGLAVGAKLVLFDGSPFGRKGRLLWRIAQAEKINVFGTSAKYLDSVKKTKINFAEEFDLSSIRCILSTGSPLMPETFDFVYQRIKADVCLSSISGGTDIISCFALGNANLPVWRGELQCIGLGLDVVAYDDAGKPLPIGEKGELVARSPFPCMPIGFWNDADGSKYKKAYFDQFPGVWSHGDYIEQTANGGIIIHGRSDTVLNPGGVRIGTAEIYRQAEQIDDVLESLVIGQRWKGDVRVVLFVKLAENAQLDNALKTRISQQIRDNTTPRHVPAVILEVPDIPRTKSGKIVELAVRQVVHGEAVKNQSALANPEALEHFSNRSELAQ